MKSSFVFPKPDYRLAITLAVVASLVAVTGALASVVLLDPSFDYDGIVVNDLGGSYDEAMDIALMADGRVVSAGYTNKWDGNDFAVTRHHTNGSLDSTFDGDGIVITDIRGESNFGTGVVLQADNKIVVCGTSGTDFALARYNVNGSLDSTYDGDGLVVTDIGGSMDVPYAIAIQPDGKVILAGVTDKWGDRDFALARYNTNGSLDGSFDGDGVVITDFWDDDTAYAMVLQPNGKILVGGFAVSIPSDERDPARGIGNAVFPMDFALVRYNANGSLDTTFDGDGKVATDINGLDNTIEDLHLQPDGMIVAVGHTGNVSQSDFTLARYTKNGALDPTFDSDGIVVTDFGGSYDLAYAVDIQLDGKILAAGFSDRLNPNDLALVRYNVNGSRDNLFDGDGIVLTNIGGMESISAVVIRPDNRIVVGGSSNHWGDYNFALARYLAGGLAYRSDGNQDGWVLETAENSNIGGMYNNVATVLVMGDSSTRKQYRSILSFNTGSLPDTVVITKAVLQLRVQATAATPFASLGPLQVDMKKGAFNAPHLEAVDFQSPATKPKIGTFTLVATIGQYQLVINPVYFSTINLAGLTQFRVNFMNDDDNDAIADYVRFYSGNFPNPKMQPLLYIEYTLP